MAKQKYQFAKMKALKVNTPAATFHFTQAQG